MTIKTHAPRLAPLLGALAVVALAGVPSTAAAATGPATPPPPTAPPPPKTGGPVALAPPRLRLRASRDDSGITLRVA
jgi:hypothetical protein